MMIVTDSEGKKKMTTNNSNINNNNNNNNNNKKIIIIIIMIYREYSVRYGSCNIYLFYKDCPVAKVNQGISIEKGGHTNKHRKAMKN